MSKNKSTRDAGSSLDRRKFLGSSAMGAVGLGAVFAGLGRTVVAQNAPPPSGGAPAGPFTPPPPEPTVSQPAPIKDLKGKVAYVTASSDGIGLGIARACSAAGMKVVIGYRNDERLKAALPLFKPGNAGVHAIKHDVTDRDGWAKLLTEINGKFGNLHLVVNNAGIKTLRQASQAKYDEWDNAVAVNFTAIYNSVAACLPHMLKHGEGGHFVTTASMGGLLPGVNAGVYTSTKIAAVGIMEALRIELESTTVGTSVFCPGMVATDNYPMGEENPFRTAQAAKAGRAPPPAMPSVGMDPLEAGERVLNGVLNNDLFILSHPEFKAGMQERFDAMMASTPPVETPIPQARIDSEVRVMRAGIYNREIAHRKAKRKSYRAV
jgi:NAD(P)-dependent dehydrogenase (short-subunit alcohol dehydrogenase family)